MGPTATLLVSCPDRRGIVAAIADFLYQHNANILHADQHQDAALGLFLMRVEWDLDGFDLDATAFEAQFAPVAARFDMHWRLAFSATRPRVAIFVSRADHCLADLLYRYRAGELRCEIPLVIANHPDTERVAAAYDVAFANMPVTADRKRDAETRQLALLREHGIELVVLARYMQILSADFVREFPDRIINIHHSFLPAFHGARPYHRACERGVKVIGATAHYVTEALDEGPIIEQDVTRVSHRDNIEDVIRKGADLEKVVLSRAVRWHLENRILTYANRTVVFD